MKNAIAGLLLVLGLIGCNKNLPMKNTETGNTIVPLRQKVKTVTILGTYAWDAETNRQGGTGGDSDFFWERVDNTKGSLVAKNGTTVEVVPKSFAAIDKRYIKSLPALRDGRIGYKDIRPGTVAVFKTGDGHYGKLRIKGYRALHDFGFKEAREYLSPSWKKFVLAKPNSKNYHLVVEYVLYN